MSENKVDTIIIGAGMAGMASAIRLLMFGKKVMIVEKHSISGGLNSYYKRGKREFDVGLHALTNTIKPHDRGKPFHKILKQLRITIDDFKLSPQRYSLIQFPEHTLRFTNEFEDFVTSIHQNFPNEVDGFLKLTEHIKNFNEVALDNKSFMAKDVVRSFIKNDELIEMIFCPLLIYGSAWENDMDFSQFAIMFKSIYFEGFSRPDGGVRTIIDLLLKKIENLGGEIKFKHQVTKILKSETGKISGVILNNDTHIECREILSTIGRFETLKLLHENLEVKPEQIGKLSFTESIFITKDKPHTLGTDATIIFYNNRPKYLYRSPIEFIDHESAVLCFPNNFQKDTLEEGWLRVTSMANFNLWNELLKTDRKAYLDKKEWVGNQNLELLKKVLPEFQGEYLFKDVFSPTTIVRYTGHLGGAVYGSPEKIRDGKFLEAEGLYLAGTDQGFLGIVGAMLSGISMTNLHLLQNGTNQ